MDISKHITAIKQLIISRLPKKRQAAGRDNSDDDTYDEQDEEDRQPGNISMTDGEKDKTLGINKQFVNIALVASGLIILVAFAYNIMDSGDGSSQQDNSQVQRNEQAADLDMAKKQIKETNYKDVQAQMQAANQQKNGNTGANGSRAAGNVQNMQPAGTQQQVPAIRAAQQPQQPYSAPYMLPSALAQIDANARRNAPNQGGKQEPAEAQNREAKDLVDKFRSAIDFAIGGGGSVADVANSGGNTASANMASYAAGYSGPDGMMLQAGTIIPMMLYTGINTDNPGQVIAQVQSDVYDTATGSTLLIPMGTKAIGSYQAGAGTSDRVAITFSTLVFPNGGSYSIGDSMVAVDDQGYNGIRGNMNKHMDAAIGRTLVNGVLSAGFTALSTIGANKANIDTSGLQSLLQSSTNIQPTVTVEPGYEFNIFVTRPISFSF